MNIIRRIPKQTILAAFLACAVMLLDAAYAAPPKKPAKTAPSSTPATTPAPASKPADTPAATTPAVKTPKAATAESTAPAVVSNEVVPPPPGVPPVLLTKQDANLCRVRVGDALPTIELPKMDDAQKTKLSDLYGKAATVVVFWAGDRRMSHTEMADLATDVIEPFASKGVAVVGVAVKEKSDQAAAAAKEVGKPIPMLVDEKGTAFAQIGSRRLPRTFVLDANGKICWFDIEYSHATRRELKQAARGHSPLGMRFMGSLEKTKVAIIGVGTVGSGVARLLLDHGDRTARHAGRTLWLEKAVARNLKKPRDCELPQGCAHRQNRRRHQRPRNSRSWLS